MAKYQLTQNGVKDTEEGWQIPNAEGNRHWAMYQAWLVEGNVPDPDPTDYFGNAKAGRVIQIWAEASQRTDVNQGKGRSAEARHLKRLSKQARGVALSATDEALSATFEAALDQAELVYEAAELAEEAVEAAADIAEVEAVVVVWPV